MYLTSLSRLHKNVRQYFYEKSFMNKKRLILDSACFADLDSFYDEADRVFTKNLGWETGHNLDAFNDLLRGGFGVFEEGELIDLIWRNSAKSKLDLGIPETLKYYQKMLKRCHPSNIPHIKKDMKALENNAGQTLFDIIVEIISGHQHINFMMQ